MNQHYNTFEFEAKKVLENQIKKVQYWKHSL